MFTPDSHNRVGVVSGITIAEPVHVYIEFDCFSSGFDTMNFSWPANVDKMLHSNQ